MPVNILDGCRQEALFSKLIEKVGLIGLSIDHIYLARVFK